VGQHHRRGDEEAVLLGLEPAHLLLVQRGWHAGTEDRGGAGRAEHALDQDWLERAGVHVWRRPGIGAQGGMAEFVTSGSGGAGL